MPQVRAKVDVDRAVLAFRSYAVATKKNGADVLNRFLRNVAYRSASFTPKTTAAKIRRDLMRDPHLRYALTSIALRNKGTGILKSPQFQKAVDRFVSRRSSSAAYLRSAWAEAVIQLGGTFRGVRMRGAEGFANKATVSKLVAEIVGITSQPNAAHASSAEAISIAAVEKAIKFVVNDMIEHAKTLLAATAAEHSG